MQYDRPCASGRTPTPASSTSSTSSSTSTTPTTTSAAVANADTEPEPNANNERTRQRTGHPEHQHIFHGSASSSTTSATAGGARTGMLRTSHTVRARSRAAGDAHMGVVKRDVGIHRARHRRSCTLRFQDRFPGTRTGVYAHRAWARRQCGVSKRHPHDAYRAPSRQNSLHGL